MAQMLSRFQQFGPGTRRFASLRSRRNRRRVLGGIAAVGMLAAAFGISSQVLNAPASAPTDDVTAPTACGEFQDAFEHEFEADSQFRYQLDAASQAVEQSDRAPGFFEAGDPAWQRGVSESINREIDGA